MFRRSSIDWLNSNYEKYIMHLRIHSTIVSIKHRLYRNKYFSLIRIKIILLSHLMWKINQPINFTRKKIQINKFLSILRIISLKKTINLIWTDSHTIFLHHFTILLYEKLINLHPWFPIPSYYSYFPTPSHDFSPLQIQSIHHKFTTSLRSNLHLPRGIICQKQVVKILVSRREGIQGVRNEVDGKRVTHGVPLQN